MYFATLSISVIPRLISSNHFKGNLCSEGESEFLCRPAPKKDPLLYIEGEKQDSPHFVGHIFSLALLLSLTKAVRPLNWGGAITTSVDVYPNSSLVVTAANDGALHRWSPWQVSTIAAF
jgi:hypothetical protein